MSIINRLLRKFTINCRTFCLSSIGLYVSCQHTDHKLNYCDSLRAADCPSHYGIPSWPYPGRPEFPIVTEGIPAAMKRCESSRPTACRDRNAGHCMAQRHLCVAQRPDRLCSISKRHPLSRYMMPPFCPTTSRLMSDAGSRFPFSANAP